MTPPVLAQLQTFLVVARLRSFSGAARELGVSPSAVSQSVRQLEEHVRAVLLTRTTRSVSVTDAGRRLVEATDAPMSQTLAALASVSAQPGEAGGTLRLTVPRMGLPILTSVVRAFRARHPHVELEISVEDRFVDLVAEGYDAGVRLSEAVDRDMVHVRLTEPARFVVVGAPEHLARHGVPQRPEDLLRHECITFRALSTGVLYAWELERGRRTWRVPVRGKVVTNDGALAITFAEEGLGLAYAFEPAVLGTLASGRLARVLEPYAATVPGHYLYYPSTAQRSPALRLFVDVARQVTSTTRS